MATDYDRITTQYQRSKLQPWRQHIECHTLFRLLGDLAGKAVLDLACGEGFYTRLLRHAGAARVVGVDISRGMIELARAQEIQEPLGIEYVIQDVKQLQLPDQFDLVVAGYLLNYASTLAELLQMCQAISRSLKPGGRFVTVNNNPDEPPAHFATNRPYGFLKSTAGELREGAAIDYAFFLDEGAFQITNYYLSIPIMEEAFATAGLREVRWHGPEVAAEGMAEFGKDFWADFLQHPPVVFIECVK